MGFFGGGGRKNHWKSHGNFICKAVEPKGKKGVLDVSLWADLEDGREGGTVEQRNDRVFLFSFSFHIFRTSLSVLV